MQDGPKMRENTHRINPNCGKSYGRNKQTAQLGNRQQQLLYTVLRSRWTFSQGLKDDKKQLERNVLERGRVESAGSGNLERPLTSQGAVSKVREAHDDMELLHVMRRVLFLCSFTLCRLSHQRIHGGRGEAGGPAGAAR